MKKTKLNDRTVKEALNGLKDSHLDYGEFLVKYSNEVLGEFTLQGALGEQSLSISLHTLHYMASLDHDRLKIFLHTYGGGINEGFAIHDTIVSLNKRVPVDIVAVGACMSMGVIVLQAARHRMATENANFMLHQLRGVTQGALGEQRDSYKHMEQLQTRLNMVLSNRTGLTIRQIDKLIDRKDYFISAQDALKLKLIDEIV